MSKIDASDRIKCAGELLGIKRYVLLPNRAVSKEREMRKNGFG